MISTPLACAEPPPGIARFVVAAQRFQELQAAAEANHTMPRLTDPEAGSSGPHEVADLLATLSDADSLFGTASYDGMDFPVMLDVCGKGQQIAINYEMNGVASVSAEKIFALHRQNLVTFQDEAVPIMAFSLRCWARMLPAMADFESHLPLSEWADSRNGLLTARLGIEIAISNGIMIIDAGSYPIKPQLQAQMASALADTACGFEGKMLAEQRKSILAMAEKVTPPLEPLELKPALERLISAMSRTDCEEQCQALTWQLLHIHRLPMYAPGNRSAH